MHILKIVFKEANIPDHIKKFSDLPEENLFTFFIYDCVKKKMHCNQLSNKLIAWFNDEREREFGYRFRGRESFRYLQHFPLVIKMLREKFILDVSQKNLMHIFCQSLLFRNLTSFSVRIINVSNDDVEKMRVVGRQLFKACCLFDSKVTPSMWNFTKVSPVHAMDCLQKYNLGL